jgi:hypothetical protein
MSERTTVDRDGNTPLHKACQRPYTLIETMSSLLDNDPGSWITKCNRDGQTPLHNACMHLRESPAKIQLLLDRSPTEVLSVADNRGYTPLHYACFWGVSTDIILRMICMCREALRMVTKYNATPLHLACQSSRRSLELIQLLVSHCQVLCLAHDKNRRSPYDSSVEFGRGEDVREFLLQATKEAAVALLVCVYRTMITVPPTVVDHIRQVIPAFSSDGFFMSYMRSNEDIRHVLDDSETFNTLLDNNDLQGMLRDESSQDLMCMVFQLMSGRINDEVEAEFKHHVGIVEAVSNATDCLYLHLRNHPFLCSVG